MSDETLSRWMAWSPADGQRVLLRTGGSEDEREWIALDELRLALPEGAGEPTVRLRFAVDRGTFSRMAERRWFQIPIGFPEEAGPAFVATRPVHLEVETAPLERGGYPLSVFFFGVEDDDARLATVIEPFVDEDTERTVNNPLFYEVVRVWQDGGPGADGIGFDRASIDAWYAAR